MKKFLNVFASLFGLLCLISSVYGQETFPRNDVADNRAEAFAITNAHIVMSPGNAIDNGTLLVREGKIENVGANLEVPPGYTEVNLEGKYLYPSFIDLHTHYGLPKPKKESGGTRFGGAEQIPPASRGAYNSNDAIKAHYRAGANFDVDEKSAMALRKAGFGAVLSFRDDGIARGTSTLVTLDNSTANKVTIKSDAAAHYALSKGSSKQNYPRSMMGYISLLRQTYLDAEWFGDQSPKPFVDQALDAWIRTQDLPQIFDAGNWINALRAHKIADEFGAKYIIVAGNDLYQRIDQIKATQADFIVSLDFPEAFDVEDPLDAEKVTLGDMLHWELAPTNPGILEQNGITFAFTAHGIKADNLRKNIRAAIGHGLSEQTALAALTTIPAEMLGASDEIGSLETGKLANFIVADGEIFAEGTTIHQNWVQGHMYHFTDLQPVDHSGRYQLNVGTSAQYVLEISGEPGKHKSKIVVDDSTTIDVRSTLEEKLVNFSFQPKNMTGKVRLSGWKTDAGWHGTGQSGDGSWTQWSATRQSDVEASTTSKPGSQSAKEDANLGQVLYPFTAFGLPELPSAEDLLIRNVTVWTNEDDGILEGTDVLLRDGKIAQIGVGLSAAGARIVDGTGKHLTAGIIDEHTHIAGGGNDVATNSGMVRIGDQVNSEQISIYRTLAGGVTAAQVLHGSANPIGGQSALIKLRWGSAPEDLKIKGAAEFIKFALGENVKRSRSQSSIRYPQTRMGVEQVYVDAFTQAEEYGRAWQSFATGDAPKPRRDLALEAMLEIINGERFITCHSYVQSEINMLMKVAERFGFNINTFTHIMEGYKVADKMAEHGVGGSSFSDWWNYKWEVRYAIPYNPTIMHNAGVLTAINSDDANMGRRLNQEAAKSIKYGGMTEEDALKMVTLNPAKLLHLDDRMGSIKAGKDADVVLWTDHPLSVYARADKTIVDGIIYFDLEEDKLRRQVVLEERNRLIQKMIGAKKAGAPTSKRSSRLDMEIHCESVLGIHSHGHH